MFVVLLLFACQGSDDLNNRRRLRRGETVDGCDLFISTSENSHSFNQAKGLNRSHTIHQDLTHSSPEDLEHTQCSSVADTMADTGVNEHSTNLSPEPEQIIGKANENMQANLEEEKEEDEKKEKDEEMEENEEDQNKGKNVHWDSTEMENIVL